MVLIFALVIGATTTVVVIGGSAISDTKEQLDMRTAENTMTQVDSQASLVGLGQSERQVVELGTAEKGDYKLDDTAGQITVSHSERSDPILQEDLGKLYYESDGTEVTYQGGGVWRSDGDGNAIMVSPPEFHYRDATLTLPIVTLDGSERIGDTAVFTHSNTVKAYPTDGNTNPIESGLVTVSVQSEFYRAWGNYFEERTSGSVDYDPDNSTATVKLTVETEEQSVDAGVLSGGTGTTIDYKNKGDFNSYNSTEGDYESSKKENGTIYTAGGITLKNKAEILGSIVAEGDIKFEGSKQTITGDLTYVEGNFDEDKEGEHVEGTISTGAEVPEITSVSGTIDNKSSSLYNHNDNSTHENDLDALEDGTCDPCNLTAGQYYIDNINFKDGGQVYLKPEGERIEVYVADDFEPKLDSRIEVIGEGRVEFYVEDELTLDPNTTITNEGDEASQFWVYMNPDGDADLQGGSKDPDNVDFTGVIYGPGTSGQSGVEVTIDNHDDIFGAVVGDLDEVANKGNIHYDEALANSAAVESGETTRPSLTYLHISENQVNVTSD